jgi:hypothetical protein
MTNPVAKRLCVTCKHSYDNSFDNEFLKCGYRDPDKVDLVTGNGKKQPYAHCSVLRDLSLLLAWSTGSCGKRGRFWESKP